MKMYQGVALLPGEEREREENSVKICSRNNGPKNKFIV